MLINIFENKSMPFYKFGEIIYLKKIEESHFVEFICNNFAKTGKKINPSQALKIAQIVECEPYYVQQLSHIVWINTEKEVDENIIESSIEDLIDQNAIFYQREFEDLSYYQIQFLKALINKVKNFSSKDVINNYNLNSSANISKIRKSLEHKDIIDIKDNIPEFIDSVFKLWIIRALKV
ncbi:MAG: hypothetical protein Q8880_07530 [Bacteroidota bacterium]|nr:hypothetical protein [Bacteroidota bacterium]